MRVRGGRTPTRGEPDQRLATLTVSAPDSAERTTGFAAVTCPPPHVGSVLDRHTALPHGGDDVEVLLLGRRATVGVSDVEDVVVAGEALRPTAGGRAVDDQNHPVRAMPDLPDYSAIPALPTTTEATSGRP